VIVERRFVGVVPASEPQSLARGAAAMFRVTRVLADGKFELSLRGKAHEELADDARHVLAVLRAHGPTVSDHSTPAEIRTLFGLSKKAFKRAVGRLLKEGSATLDDRGCVRVKAASRPS
jgi:predicted RNA-binding protein (virulence factor B family)